MEKRPDLPASSRPAKARTDSTSAATSEVALPSLTGEKASVSVLDLATSKVIQKWQVPNGGSPDMGGV